MEKFRHLFGDYTPNTVDRDLASRLRKIRRENGGNIGVFFISPIEAECGWEDQDTGFKLDTGEGYLEIDLLKNADIVRSQINDSLTGIAHYLVDRDDLKYVTGTTYEKMAELFQHFGFTPSHKPTPDGIDEVITNYPDTPRGISGKPIGKIYLMFQERNDLLQRYLPEYKPRLK